MSVDRIVETVADVAPEIRAGLPGRRRHADEENPSGERQLAADVYADRLLEERLLALDSVGTYASEEREEVTRPSNGRATDAEGEGDADAEGEGDAEGGSGDGEERGGAYHVALDPLDGSSNLKSNNPMGTILSVYDEPLPARGRSLVAAAYVLYGPITTMMVARDGRVREYVVEDERIHGDVRDAGNATDGGDTVDAGATGTTGARLTVVDDRVTVPEEPVVYGFGGRAPDWPEAVESYVREVEARELKLRYGGAMIADVNQVMTYGGIFAYPGLQSRPEGKLRLQFECNPMAYIVESAGGRSSDGERSVLDVEPTALHQRTPVYLGNDELIDRLEASLAEDTARTG